MSDLVFIVCGAWSSSGPAPHLELCVEIIHQNKWGGSFILEIAVHKRWKSLAQHLREALMLCSTLTAAAADVSALTTNGTQLEVGDMWLVVVQVCLCSSAADCSGEWPDPEEPPAETSLWDGTAFIFSFTPYILSYSGSSLPKRRRAVSIRSTQHLTFASINLADLCVPPGVRLNPVND